MKTTRWIGVAGAVLLVAYLFWHPAEDPASIRNSPYAVIHMFGATAWTLIVIGMLGKAESIWQQAGRIGWTAYLMAFVGSVLWVGLMFFDGFVNHALVIYAPELVHTNLQRTLQFYGWALLAVAACLILYAVGYAALALTMARRRLLSIPAAALLASGASVLGAALLSHRIQPIVFERIGAVPFAIGFILLMVRQRSATGPAGQ